MTLFGENTTIIRTLGLYQPYASLMLHGKVETRWVRKGRKPPFPPGKYLIYSTAEACDYPTLYTWSGSILIKHIQDILENEPTRSLTGYALAIVDLREPVLMKPINELECFVKYVGEELRKDKFGRDWSYMQWCLPFRKVQRIEPFEFKGKQGVGILPESEHSKIKICTTTSI